MADEYRLTQTGAQVQSILNKADKLPATVGTSGQVLTADGSGGAAWTTPQGGGSGTQLYLHNITYTIGTDTIVFNVTSNDGTQVNTWQGIRDLINASLFFEAVATLHNTYYVFVGNGVAFSYGLTLITNNQFNALSGRSCFIQEFDSENSKWSLVTQAFSDQVSGTKVVTDVVTAL